MGSDLASEYRHLFPVLDNLTYLNSCSQGALAIPVRDALNQYLDGMYEKGSLWDQWLIQLDELRDLVALAFSTKKSNVAITTTASAGINSVLSSFDFSGAKNQVITTSLEFPTMGQILHAQERRGAEVIHIESNEDGLLDLNDFEAALSERVALVAITHVCYRNGAMIDIKAVIDISHKYNIPVLIDAYQSVGSMPIDFDGLGADFMVGGFLKYMLGIPGVAFLLASEKSQLIPTKTGWFAARDVFAMDVDAYKPSIDARRFEEGTPPIPSLYAANAGLNLLLRVKPLQAWNHTVELHQEIRQELQKLGLKVVTPSRDGTHGVMLAIAVPDQEKAVALLERHNIVVSSRDGKLRISPHFYNNQSDVKALVTILHLHREVFQSANF